MVVGQTGSGVAVIKPAASTTAKAGWEMMPIPYMPCSAICHWAGVVPGEESESLRLLSPRWGTLGHAASLYSFQTLAQFSLSSLSYYPVLRTSCFNLHGSINHYACFLWRSWIKNVKSHNISVMLHYNQVRANWLINKLMKLVVYHDMTQCVSP